MIIDLQTHLVRLYHKVPFLDYLHLIAYSGKDFDEFYIHYILIFVDSSAM